MLEESAGNVEALDVVIEEDDETITVDLLLDKFSAVAAGVESDESGVAAASESDAAKTTRTVAEDGTVLTAETVDGVDTYTVTKTSGLTVSYYNSIDAEDMVDSFGALITNNRYWSQIKSLLSLSDSSTGWEILKKCYSYITDDTYVCLNYIFSDGIDLDEVDLEDLAGSISLESSLFTFSGDADDLSIDTSTNTLTITCWWNSSGAKKAVSNDDLGEMTLEGVTVPIVSDWDGADSLEITADGTMTGMMYVGIKITLGRITLLNISEDLNLGTTTLVENNEFCVTLAKTSLTVEKEWDDQDDADGLRPESIEVALYADGASTGESITLSDDNNWTASFEDLYAHDLDHGFPDLEGCR